MRAVFADTNYWVALTDPKDQWHRSAVAAARSLASRPIVTTDEVLTEFLAFFAARGSHFREVAVLTIRSIFRDPSVEVVHQTHNSFLTGLAYYESRLDKGYSLTDCVSMNVFRARGLTEVLTNDEHFRQEGFQALL
ncbi:MAG: type II toxin-antitoxin system VapC family toxin [Isosphaeraceae bacterium]